MIQLLILAFLTATVAALAAAAVGQGIAICRGLFRKVPLPLPLSLLKLRGEYQIDKPEALGDQKAHAYTEYRDNPQDRAAGIEKRAQRFQTLWQVSGHSAPLAAAGDDAR